MKVFIDTEFTGLHKDTTLISLGLVAENNETFYAEFKDYDKTQVDEWLQKNVIDSLILEKKESCSARSEWNPKTKATEVYGDSEFIVEHLQTWLSSLGGWANPNPKIEIWSDCLSYDWMLFCQLFGGALDIPENIYYIPFDICTVFKIKEVDPDISREEFAGIIGDKHNSLHDAKVIKACYDKVMLAR